MQRAILAAVIGSACAVRAVAIWLSRPEFTGWFNHTYYYWVQTRGLLERGELPYADLPLTFHLYAGVAALLQMAGFDAPSAIVNASRLVMCAVPALIALPVFLFVRRVNDGAPLTIPAWCIVAVSAFLPLTLAHMPELLQKNMLGLLLLAGFMYCSYAYLDAHRTRYAAAAAALLVVIAGTHIGTLAVALLFVIALLVALACERGSAGRVAAGIAGTALLAAACVALVAWLDVDALLRLVEHLHSSLPNSFLGGLFAPGPLSAKLAPAFGIVVPLAALLLMLRTYRRHREAVRPAARVFWPACALLAYLLVLPVYDLAAVPRLVLFMPLPLLFVLAFQLRYGCRPRVHRLLAAAASLGAAVMVFGEAMNLLRLYPDKHEIHRELLDFRDRYRLTRDDFVLTEYGVNPIANWFLGTRSGLITAFHAGDMGAYDRVFVLNTAQGRTSSIPESGAVTYTTPQARYEAMRQTVVAPDGVAPLGAYRHFDVYRLESLPANWLFDPQGTWIGWRAAPGRNKE